MDQFLIARFSNESGVISAEAGWSADGWVFSEPRETAHAILRGAPETLVDVTKRQLVASLCATHPEQAAEEIGVVAGGQR